MTTVQEIEWESVSVEIPPKPREYWNMFSPLVSGHKTIVQWTTEWYSIHLEGETRNVFRDGKTLTVYGFTCDQMNTRMGTLMIKHPANQRLNLDLTKSYMVTFSFNPNIAKLVELPAQHIMIWQDMSVWIAKNVHNQLKRPERR